MASKSPSSENKRTETSEVQSKVRVPSDEVQNEDDLEQKNEEKEAGEEEEEDDDDNDSLYAELEAKYNLKPEEESEKNDSSRKSSAEKVHLNDLKLKYDPKKSSTLKPVLTEYGMDDPTREKRKLEKQKRAQRKRRESEGDEYAKEKAEQEYYIGVYDSLNNLREKYYRVYLEKLQDRVEEQRKQIKQKSIELEEKISKQNERPKFERKLEHHVLEHDNSFLQNVAKSETYKLVKYETQLRQRGKLRHQHELEEYWRLAREEPDKLRDMLRREKIEEIKDPEPDHISSYYGSHLSDSFSTTRSSTHTSLPGPERTLPIDFRPLTQIEEAKESSRPSTRDPQSWAITGQFPAQNTSKPFFRKTSSPVMEKRLMSVSSRRSTQMSISTKKEKKDLDPHQKARLAAKELEQRFPQKELPPMSCFTMELGDKGPDPHEILEQLKQQRRQKERKLFVKRIRKMFHLSQSNSASTQRIMSKHGDDFDLALEGPTMDTLLQSYDLYKEPHPPVSEEEKQLQEKPWLRYVRHRAIVTIAEESESSVKGSDRSKIRSGSSRRTGSKVKKPSTEPEKPPALDLNSLEENSKVIEAKCLSTNWTNYLKVGKSVFAK